jgi:hypothetical protein
VNPVEIEINNDEGTMVLKMAGFTIAEAFLTAEAGWIVLSTRELFRLGLDRDQAITALTIIEFRVYGMPESNAAIQSFLSELPE